MALPTIKPLVLRELKKPFNHPDWIFEPKHDGFRAMLFINGEKAFFRSRSGNVMSRFAKLAGKIREELKVETAIIDGEIASLEAKTGRSIFMNLMKGIQPIRFMAFDLLYLNGQNLAGVELIDRKTRLAEVVAGKTMILPVDHIKTRGIDFMREAQARNLEGIVAKKINGLYKRTSVWYKIKNPYYDQAAGRARLFHRQRGRRGP